MRRARPFILIGISLFAAMASSSLVYKWMRANQAQAVAVAPAEVVVEPARTTMIALAAVDVPWGSRLTEEMIELVPFPTDHLPEGYIEDLTQVKDRFVRADIGKNEAILEPKLAPADSTVGGVAAVMDPQMRAMAVRVDDEIGVAGFLKPGDRVDVFVTMKATDQRDPMSKMVLANRRILAIGTEMVRIGLDDEPRPVKVITLEVEPEEGEKLALAAAQGKFRLALRHPLNQEPSLTTGANFDSLMASYRSGKKKDDAKHSIQVIKGGAVSTVTF